MQETPVSTPPPPFAYGLLGVSHPKKIQLDNCFFSVYNVYNNLEYLIMLPSISFKKTDNEKEKPVIHFKTPQFSQHEFKKMKESIDRIQQSLNSFREGIENKEFKKNYVFFVLERKGKYVEYKMAGNVPLAAFQTSLLEYLINSLVYKRRE